MFPNCYSLNTHIHQVALHPNLNSAVESFMGFHSVLGFLCKQKIKPNKPHLCPFVVLGLYG